VSKQQLAVIQPARKPVGRPGERGDRPDNRRLPARANEVTQVVNEFQADTVELDTRPEPFLARALLWALALFVITAISWATFAQIDRVVSARGKVVSVAPNVIVQPLEAAIIRSIEVKVGDVVKAGTVLATLDPTFAQADVEQIEARIASLDASINRLEAEQMRRPYAPVPKADRFGYEQLQEAIYK
jgi:hemolysin D